MSCKTGMRGAWPATWGFAAALWACAGGDPSVSAPGGGEATWPGTDVDGSDAYLDALYGPADDPSRLPEATAPVAKALQISARTDPTFMASTPLCAVAGEGDVRMPDQADVRMYGTDLGITYVHGDRLQWLFGDTWLSPEDGPISPGRLDDDAYGSTDLKVHGSGEDIEASCRAGTGVPVTLGVDEHRQLVALSAGRPLGAYRSPVAAFSAGKAELAFFHIGKPRGCHTDADCGELRCDPGLGWMGAPLGVEWQFTLPCVDGTRLDCRPNTLDPTRDGTGQPAPPGPPTPSGLCVDPGAASVVRTTPGRVAGVATYLELGVRGADQRTYVTTPWLTTRFKNLAVATVAHFEEGSVPTPEDFGRPDFTSASEDQQGARVFLFGRPQFVGSPERNLHLYLAYMDLSEVTPSAAPSLRPRFFAGLDPESGLPRFSDREAAAGPVDLGGGSGDPDEPHHVVQQMSVAYVPALERFVMLYGGLVSTVRRTWGNRCGIADIFAPVDCERVDTGNGAIRLRTAHAPWGPWSPPVDILISGDPAEGPDGEGEFGPGGLLRHPECGHPDCAPHSTLPNFIDGEYGALYGPNLIEPWTVVRGDLVDLYWNVSTWDPYRVVLVKSSLRMGAGDAGDDPTPPHAVGPDAP